MRHLYILLTAALLMTLHVERSQSIGGWSYMSAVAQSPSGDQLEELDELEDSTPKRGASKNKDTAKSTRSSAPKASGKSPKKTGRLQVTQVSKRRGKATSSSEVYLKQIQRIESQVNELKEEIFRSRTRLAILKESVLASGLSGTELRILHRNQMGANFKLERILYILDNDPLRQAVDRNGELDRQEEIEIINGPIRPGNHTLQVELVYRGNGFGVFSYLQSYRFTLNDVLTFRAEEGKRVTISAIGYERSGIGLELKDRPDIRFDRVVDDLDEEADQAERDRQKSRPEPAP